VRYNKLSRHQDHRRSLLRNQVVALLSKERIVTTEARAKSVASMTEKLITLAKEPSLHHRRLCRQVINDEDVVKKLFDTVGPRFQSRGGGYTRIAKLGPRQGDAAPMVVLELL